MRKFMLIVVSIMVATAVSVALLSKKTSRLRYIRATDSDSYEYMQKLNRFADG